MKNRFILIATAFVALLFVGCAKDATEDNLSNGNGVAAGTATVYADIESMTRTSLTDPGEGTAQVLWSAGDEIGVVTTEGTVRKAVIADGIGSASATFTVEGAVEGESYECAFYPYVYNGNTETTFAYESPTLSVKLPVYQTYTSDGSVFSSSTNTMVATVEENGRLAFKSVMGCLELKISGSQVVKGITVKNSVTKVAGDATIDPSTQTLTLGTANTSFSFVYLECPEPVQLSETPTSFYVLVPAGTYDCLQIGVMTEDGSYVRSATASHTVKRAVIKPINCGNLDDMIDTSSAVDLSAAGYANCYIVSPGGGEQVYSFETKFVDGTDVINEEVDGDDKSLAYAQLLWAEELGIAYDVRFDKAAGKIYFKYDGSTVGNARIVVCNDFFASAAVGGGVKKTMNLIAWGWHIWATPEPSVGITVDGNTVKDINSDGTITAEEVSEATVIGLMDRNLGATWVPSSVDEIENMTIEQATASTGCFYQMGNLHPYPRQKTLGWNVSGWQNSAVKYRFGFTQYVQDWSHSTSVKPSVMMNVCYPMYRYGGQYVPSVTTDASKYTSTAQWLKDDFIGGNDASNSAGEMALWGGQGPKAKFDPCPAGWVVPHQGNIYQMATGAPKSVDGGASKNVNLQFYKLGVQLSDGVFAGTYLTYNDGASFDWYPCSGYLGGGGSIGSSGVKGYYWGCPYYSGAKLNYNTGAYAITESTMGTDGYFKNSYTQPWYIAATGYQIRCVKRD